MPSNVGLQAKCLRLIGIRVVKSVFADKFESGSRINVLAAHAQTLSSQKLLNMASRARNDRVFIGKRVR